MLTIFAAGFKLPRLDAYSDAIDGLERTAADCPRDDEGVHFYHLRNFPYTVWYEIAGDDVTVLAVAHQRRQPRYWKQR